MKQVFCSGLGIPNLKFSDVPLNCFALHIFECYLCSALSTRILNLIDIQWELSSSPFCKGTQQLCGNLKVLNFDDGKITIANYRFGSWLTKLKCFFQVNLASLVHFTLRFLKKRGTLFPPRENTGLKSHLQATKIMLTCLLKRI